MAPRYRVLNDTFIAPERIRAGAIIETGATFGPHLEPLNAEANAKAEEWYTWETDELDPKTKVPTGKRIRPHEKFRPTVPGAQIEAATAEVISEAPTVQPGLSLAELAIRKSTDQRPPPAKVHTTEPAIDPDAPTIIAPSPAPSTRKP